MAWYDKQKAILGNYRRMARLPDEEYRALLHEITGCSSSTDGSLTQADFDWFMAAMEGKFQYRVQEGFCPPPPPKVNVNYWRGRLAKNGEANERMLHLLRKLWEELQTMLPPEARNIQYLRAIAAQANRRRVETIAELKGWQICVVIEALKARIFQERKRVAADRAGLPGTASVPDHASAPAHEPVCVQCATPRAPPPDTEDASSGDPVQLPELNEVPF